MKIRPFFMEEWLMNHRFNVTYNLAESGVDDLTVAKFLELTGCDLNELKNVKLEDQDTRGTNELREAIASTYESVSPDEILVTTGTSEALFVLFNVLLDKRSSVVIPFPAFQALYEVPRSIGCDLRFVPLLLNEGFRLNVDRLESMVDETTKLIILNTPHNPSGITIPQDDILCVKEIADHYGAFVLCDEHYRFLPLKSDSQFTSAFDLDREIIVTGSITKCFGLIGLRVGWLICPAEIIAPCRDYKDYLTHTLSPLTDFFTKVALDNRSLILERNMEIIHKNFELLKKFMNNHSDFFQWTLPEAGVVTFPFLPEGISSDSFCRRLIEEESVFILPGSSFEMDGYVRLNFGVRREKFANAIERISAFLKRGKL